MAPSSDDHHLVHHQSTPSILYSELEQAIHNSSDSYPSSSINNSNPSGRIDLSSDHNIVSHPDFRIDSPRKLKEPPTPRRLSENNSTATTDLTHDPHIPHSASPQHFQAHQPTPAFICPSQNSTTINNVSPLSNDTDVTHTIQSGRLHQANHQLDTLPSAGQSQATSNPNPPLKKNGKPLAQCPYCGMTFKKLEHCQRHERTHTLARPYPCSVCSKTFARQDTLNRHLRLHSRSEGRIAGNKSSSQGGQESQAPVSSSPGSLKSPPPRERGLSLSALEHSSFPVHHTRNASIVRNGPRQSISLPLQRPQPNHLPPPFHSDGNRLHHIPITSHITSQPPRSSALCADARAGLPTEVRRGSWCPGAQNHGEFGISSTSETTPPHLVRNHSSHNLQRSLDIGNWEVNLTTTFGLVESGIGPVPLSAPATCTNWSALGIDLGRSGNSYATSSPSAIPTWENLSQFEIQPQTQLNWQSLGRLEEEDQGRPESEQSHQNACQVILSSPSQPESFDQPNTVDPNGLTGSFTSILGGPETNTFWCFPAGSNPPCQSSSSSSQSQPAHRTVNDKEIGESFDHQWNCTPQKQPALDLFNPVIWHQPPTTTTVCHDHSQDLDHKILLNDNNFTHSNPLSISSNSWENNNAWDEIVELGF